MNVISTQLHPAQRDIYVDQLIHTESPHYNIGGYIKLKGSLDKAKFYEAVNSAPKVFDAFKMRFDLSAADARCYLDSGYEKLEISELDFSNRPNPVHEAAAWMESRFNTYFIIQKKNLLFEHCLLKISNDEHWFFGRYHHLITDGYGFIIFVQYVSRKYKSLVTGDSVEFVYPSYLDETVKASEYLNSSIYESDSKYWKEKIFEPPNKIIKKKFLQQNISEKTNSSYILNITDEQRNLLETVQLATKTGLQQLTIAALLIYFGKTSEQSEFIFGIPVHKRGSKQLRNIVGMFSGILPFKGTFQKDFVLADFLQQINQTQKSDYRHQNYPLSEINRNLKGKSSEDYLYEVSINYELLNFELDFGNGIESNILRLESSHEKNPLQLFWRDYGNRQQLQMIVNFGNEYFSQREIELFVKRILFIIEQFPGSLERNIGSIKIFPEEESLLLEKFSGTLLNYPCEKNIVEMFEEQVSKTPDNIALVYEEQQLTYRELNERSNQLAHYLRSKEVEEETLVPMLIERGVEMLVGIIGILKAGGAYVPIDPQYPEERIKFMLEDSCAAVIVSSIKSSSKLPASEKYDIIKLDEDESLFSKLPTTNLQTSLAPNQLSYVIYTSGSTGKPKGVMIEHRAVVNLINVQSRAFNFNSDERILQFSNYCFDASVEQIFLALFNGASLILFPEGLQLNIELFETFLKEKKITHLHATPSFLENLNSFDNEYLKRVIAGGEVCKKELAENWKNDVSFFNEYGPTETTVTAIEYHDNYDIEKNISLPIGKPLANIQIYILNEGGELCPVGEPGELCIAGDCLARGYLNHPELTAEKFIENPFGGNSGMRLYKTGDIARWLTDGNIEYLGRKDEQVKIRGYRIELGEIESVLQDCKLVSKSAVLARHDSKGNNQLIAYVVPKGIFERESIQTYLKKRLPEYMIPPMIVELESLPLMSNGKIDKKALPDPDVSKLLNSQYAAADTELEFQLAELWKDILKIDKVGINDNFFELGGHSLNAIQLTSGLHKLMNIKTDIGTIFSNPTISKLARVIILEKQNQFTEIKKLPESEYYNLSHAQKRFWILSNFKNGSEAYNVSKIFVIEGNLNLDAFKNAFNSVIERHEILRTIFADVDGEPMQKIISLSETGFQIHETDLRNKPNAEQIIEKWLEDDASLAFDLKTGPLIRATLFTETNEKFTLVINIHHIISDGWSKGIFINEFLNLYKAYIKNEKSNLAPLPLQYKDYAAWHSDSFGRQREYWKNLYEKNIPVLDFPLDYERPKVLSYFGDTINNTVSQSLTSKLCELAVNHNMSLNNLLLSLYGLIVARYSGEEEVVIGTVSSGRSHPDLENLIGVFINFLPIRLSPKRYLKLSEYLSNSLNTLVQAYSNQDYPFDLMVEDNIKRRDVSRNPFFDTMINFQFENDFQDKVNNEKNQTGIIIKPHQSIQEDLFQSVLDFKLDVVPANEKLNLHLSYNSKIFSKQRMNIFLEEFVELLDGVVNEPDRYLTQYGKWEDEKVIMKTIQAESETTVLPVNLCASFVIEPVKEYMEYWSKEFELNIKVSFAPYNQVFQQLLNPGSLLYGNKGINILFIRIEDWLRDQKGLSISEQINFLSKIYSELISIIENVRKKTFIPFLVGIVPVYSISNFPNEIVDHINNLNIELELFLKKQPSFQLLDLNKIAVLYDIEEMYDPKSDEIGHLPFTPEYYAALGTYLTRKLNSFINQGYKVIALDCDNTLWKGICGELGASNVNIDEDFIKLQEFFWEKYNEGFLLALCSKNNEDDVWEVFDQHPEMKIKREHIAAYRINWEPKPDNLLAISKELNLGMNSIILVDDSEFEAEQMSLSCPDVLSLTLPEDPSSFSSFLNHIWAFDYFLVTDEDRKRNEMYRVEKKRKEEQVKFGSLHDFLESLNIEVNIRSLNEKDIERAVQLSLRTNQFNLNGVRKTQEDIAKSINDENCINRIIEVKDRFGDYGIVGLVMGMEKQNTLLVETFLLSCRVLGRNVEDIVLSELKNYCLIHGLDSITPLFKPTIKNKPFQEFFSRTEWTLNQETKTYSLT